MESQIKIRATVPEMNTFFEEESGVRYMEIRDRRYSSDEIERMPESKFNSKVFMWAVRLRHLYNFRDKKEAGRNESQTGLILKEDNLC